MENYRRNSTWREFQKISKARKKRREKAIRYIKLLALLFLLFAGGFLAKDWMESTPDKTSKTPPLDPVEKQEKSAKLTGTELRPLISAQPFFKQTEKHFVVKLDGNPYYVQTSLDVELQKFLLAKLERLKTLTRGKPQRIAFTVLEPDTGWIRAMAGFDLSDPDKNPCLTSDYPAASLFKIITAAAAVQEKGFTPKTPLYYNGGKYTLYKRQLKNSRNRYTRKVYFEDAFADSINPVFGKIAQNTLGHDILARYSENFGFNNKLDGDLEVGPARLVLDEEKPYQWAEVGCGFNKTTTVSPLFAAMMAGSVVHSGKMYLPMIVKTVINVDDTPVYKGEPAVFKNPVAPETAAVLARLMQETIRSGTARKSFRGYSRDSVLSGLKIGGKTGSLYNRDRTVKYDLFTGFAQDKKSGKQLAVSVMVGHRKYIGTRASRYARMIFKEFFENHSVSETQ